MSISNSAEWTSGEGLGSAANATARPRLPERLPPIQLPYVNTYDSIWEYQAAFDGGAIDWAAVLASKCPVCGAEGCYRQITPYHRVVIDLIRSREETVPIARFLCRRRQRTFSLLPCQLAPYHRYTVESIVGVIFAVQGVCGEEDCSVAAAALRALPADSSATPFLVGFWLGVLARSFRRAHATLLLWYDLDSVVTAAPREPVLDEVYLYLSALGPRGPPRADGLDEASRRYGSAVARHLIGSPSQERIGTR